jgi:DNA-binding transcriptional ArsR family regulator
MAAAKEIRGNTLRVYLCLLRHGACELRDVQHEVGLSSPSLASYHLGRLVEAGYVKQDEQGGYVATGKASGEILAGYSKIGAAVVPQLLFFALLFTILAAFFSFEVLTTGNFEAYLVAVTLAAVAALWYETVRLWRELVA